MNFSAEGQKVWDELYPSVIEIHKLLENDKDTPFTANQVMQLYSKVYTAFDTLNTPIHFCIIISIVPV